MDYYNRSTRSVFQALWDFRPLRFEMMHGVAALLGVACGAVGCFLSGAPGIAAAATASTALTGVIVRRAASGFARSAGSAISSSDENRYYMPERSVPLLKELCARADLHEPVDIGCARSVHGQINGLHRNGFTHHLITCIGFNLAAESRDLDQQATVVAHEISHAKEAEISGVLDDAACFGRVAAYCGFLGALVAPFTGSGGAPDLGLQHGLNTAGLLLCAASIGAMTQRAREYLADRNAIALLGDDAGARALFEDMRDRPVLPPFQMDPSCITTETFSPVLELRSRVEQHLPFPLRAHPSLGERIRLSKVFGDEVRQFEAVHDCHATDVQAELEDLKGWTSETHTGRSRAPA